MLHAINSLSLRFGAQLGFSLSRLEYIWDSDSQFAKENNEPSKSKNHLLSLLPLDKIVLDDSSYENFVHSILGYYFRTDIEIHYAILIGVSIQRCQLLDVTSDKAYKEMLTLAMSSLKSIPHSVIPDRGKLFEIIYENRNKNFYDILDILDINKDDSTMKDKSSKVFIVHGHDNESKQEIARFLEKLGFEAIILHEQADDGKTIIEKIETYADEVSFGIVLYTECDIGRAKTDPVTQDKYRARQNVVFEHGYLIGKLGREKVCALIKGDIETPSDMSGIVYTNMDSDGAWKLQLSKNMKAIGLRFDANQLF